MMGTPSYKMPKILKKSMKEHSNKSPDELKISFSKAEQCLSCLCFSPRPKADSDALMCPMELGWGRAREISTSL